MVRGAIAAYSLRHIGQCPSLITRLPAKGAILDYAAHFAANNKAPPLSYITPFLHKCLTVSMVTRRRDRELSQQALNAFQAVYFKDLFSR